MQILIPLMFLISHSLMAGNPELKKTPRDTSSAVVVYDASATFIPNATLGANDYSALIDSLLMLDSVPLTLVNQLNVYRSLAGKSKYELDVIIDSLFALDVVPQPVLNAVNIYMVAAEDFLSAPTGFAAYVPYSANPFPADAFYSDWNEAVPNPFRNNLALFDSTLQLLLVDEESNCGFQSPFEGVVTSNFGWRYGRNHNGIDIDLEVWDPVHAAFPGVVRVARNYAGFGRVVVVRHHNGLETIYAHLHRFKVKSGDEVEAGDVIGLGGSSGNSTGSHLHFEVRFQGVPIKPSQIIDFKNHCLRSDRLLLQKSGAFLSAVPAGQNTYEVRSGDYLYKIARQFGTTVDVICSLNGLQRNQSLKTGQKLIVGI